MSSPTGVSSPASSNTLLNSGTSGSMSKPVTSTPPGFELRNGKKFVPRTLGALLRAARRRAESPSSRAFCSRSCISNRARSPARSCSASASGWCATRRTRSSLALLAHAVYNAAVVAGARVSPDTDPQAVHPLWITFGLVLFGLSTWWLWRADRPDPLRL